MKRMLIIVISLLLHIAIHFVPKYCSEFIYVDCQLLQNREFERYAYGVIYSL